MPVHSATCGDGGAALNQEAPDYERLPGDGPLDETDCLRIVEDLREGREVLPDKQLRRRPRAIDLPMGDGLPSAGRGEPIVEHPTASGNDVMGDKDM